MTAFLPLNIVIALMFHLILSSAEVSSSFQHGATQRPPEQAPVRCSLGLKFKHTSKC